MKTLKKMPAWLYLFISNSLILLLGFVFYIAITFTILGNISMNQSKQNLQIFTKTLINLITQTPNLDFTLPISSNFSPELKTDKENGDYFIKTVSKNNPDFRITIVHKNGTVLADSIGIPSQMENHLSRPEVIAAFSSGEGLDIHVSSVHNKNLIYYATKFFYNEQELVMRVSMPTTTSVFFTKGTHSNLILLAIIILLIILLRSFFTTKHILSPLKTITAATLEYKKGNFSYKPKIDSPRELAELSNRMGDMATTIKTNIEHIANQRDEIEALFNNTAQSIIVFDDNLQVLKYNEQATELFSLSFLNTEKTPLISVLRNTELINFITKQTTSITTNTEQNTQEIETVITQPSNRMPINILARCSRISTTEETVKKKHYILTLTNITKLKHLEQTRKDFVANVSHELKTPITSIQGFIETLQDGAIKDLKTSKRFLNIMAQESKRMSSIISDLLTISQLEQEHLQLEKNHIKVQELIQSVILYHKEEAVKKNIHISTALQKSLTINGNIGLLEQAIGNIILNALKYCPENSNIEITTEKIPNATVKIVIQDNGNGIPESAQARVFERFYRVDKGRSRDQGGTGLGLSITRHCILLHDGIIYCQPRPDKKSGARFVIELPLIQD